MHSLDLRGSARDHGEFCVVTFEIELTDHAVMRLLHQKHSRARFQLILDQFEFSFGQPQSLRVFPIVGVGAWKEHLRGRLFDQSSTDGAVEYVARTLRRKAHYTVELSPRLGPVLRKILERGIGQQPPE